MSVGPASEVRVRAATEDDMPHIHRMIHELAQFEGMPQGPQLSVEDLLEDGFRSSSPWFFALVAELGYERRTGGAAGGAGGLAGYAICNRAYSSWTRRAMYLEDLYVSPAARRRRVATALLRHLCQLARAEGVTRVDWHVLEDNEPAKAFYFGIGARDLRVSEGRAALRLDEPAIAALAAGGAGEAGGEGTPTEPRPWPAPAKLH